MSRDIRRMSKEDLDLLTTDRRYVGAAGSGELSRTYDVIITKAGEVLANRFGSVFDPIPSTASVLVI